MLIQNHSQQLRKKWVRPFGSIIIAFSGSTNLYKHGNEPQQRFLEDFVLHICKGYRPLSTCENIYLCKLIFCQCPHFVFPSHLIFVEILLPKMVQKTMDLHVLPKLETTTTIFVNINLQMYKGGVDIFALVINYLDESQTPRHVIVGLFEVYETTSNSKHCWKFLD